ncbi:MAG: aminoglycoside phosphotransferase family protein, partial [Gammaproteobacteria bacterium]|nr:aminoglycoside phosphotransferase family protein [Gammaproteobacteria bacterium]
MSEHHSCAQIRSVLAAYTLEPVRVQPIASGLINKTYRVTATDGQDYILQAVHPMFPAAVNLDIDVVTRHLQRTGLSAPRLLQHRAGAVYHHRDGGVWRLFNYIDGTVHERLQQPALAGAAGALLGRVHHALAQLDYDLRAPKPDVHDTSRHLRHLQQTLKTRGNHSNYARLKPLGEAILERLRQAPALPDTVPRLVHGDPKISNFIFSADNREAL